MPGKAASSIAILVCALAWPREATAQLFQVTCAGMCDPVSLELKRQIEASVNENLPEADASTYLQGTADANALSSSLVGVDYANEAKTFLLSPNIGAGVNLGEYQLGDLLTGDVKGKNLRGLGATPSLLLGLNLAKLGLKKYSKWRLFLNFGQLKPKSDTFNLEVITYGLHVRYRIFKPKAWWGTRLLRWNGLHFSTGVQSQSLKVNYSERKNEDFTVSGQTASIDGDIVAQVESETLSVPLELSSGIQFLYLFTFFAGIGINYYQGETSARAGGDLPITSSIPGSQLTGVLRLGEKARPEEFGARTFAGLQINLPAVKLLSAQLDHNFVSKTWGVGLRLLTTTW